MSSLGSSNGLSFLDTKGGLGMPTKGRVRNESNKDHIQMTEEGLISSKQDTGIGTTSTPLFSPAQSFSDPSALGYEEGYEEDEEGNRFYPDPDAPPLVQLAPNSPQFLTPNSPSMSSVNGSPPIAGRRQMNSVSGMKVSIESPTAMTDHFSNSTHGICADVPEERPRRGAVPHRPDSIVQGDKVGLRD